ncbi:hypothetical protein [Aquipuribacter sp. SD81]|uniref:hypothetical protein n=1 Tax=Aquipuribacter sp. SD81 TaxID=3127703 RepID=UPI0030194D0D
MSPTRHTYRTALAFTLSQLGLVCVVLGLVEHAVVPVETALLFVGIPLYLVASAVVVRNAVVRPRPA